MTDGANGCMAICIGDSVVACVMLCYKSNHSLFSVYNVPGSLLFIITVIGGASLQGTRWSLIEAERSELGLLSSQHLNIAYSAFFSNKQKNGSYSYCSQEQRRSDSSWF